MLQIHYINNADVRNHFPIKYYDLDENIFL